MKHITLTLHAAAMQLHVSRDTLERGLRQAGIRIERRKEFTLREIVAGVSGDLKAERIRETRARANLLEREDKIKGGEQMDAADVRNYVTNCFRPIQETIRPMPDVLAPLVNPSDPEHARQHLDAWIVEFYKRVTLPNSEIVAASKSEPKAGE